MASNFAESIGLAPSSRTDSRKKTAKESDPKKPEGMTRELFSLLKQQGNRQEILSYKQPLPKLGVKLNKASIAVGRRTRKWMWAPFENPCRSDGLRLCHWDRIDRIENKEEYVFAKMNKSLNIPTYTTNEYERFLNNCKAWPKAETDHLFDLARRFDRRWFVMVDKWQYKMPGTNVPTKSLLEMKQRFYDVLNSLNEARDTGAERIYYDTVHEGKRREQYLKLWNRTDEQIEDEKRLLSELKQIETRKKYIEKKHSEIQKKIIERDPISPAGILSSAISPAPTIVARKKVPIKSKIVPVIKGAPPTPKVVTFATSEIQFDVLPIRWTEFKTAGPHARSLEQKLPSNIGLKKTGNIDKIIEYFSLPISVDSHEDSVNEYNALRNEIIVLQEYKSMMMANESNLEGLRNQYIANGKEPFIIPLKYKVVDAKMIQKEDEYGSDGELVNKDLADSLPSTSRTLMSLIDANIVNITHTRKRKSTIPVGFMDTEKSRTRDEVTLKEQVHAYCHDKLLPCVTKQYRGGSFDPSIFPEMGAMGLLGSPYEGYGCSGTSDVGYGLIAREVERIDSGYRSIMSVQTSLVIGPIVEMELSMNII
uniref:SWR1-complex protein 4 n=1 Tax=Rhabditophanes sp. KR3021 TaxID=114890 RepID=A0AC35TMY3_9BILA